MNRSLVNKMRPSSIPSKELTFRSTNIHLAGAYDQFVNNQSLSTGLSYLQLVRALDPNDQDPSPRYFCRLCVQEANLPNMINHVIGRKHRQKYLVGEMFTDCLSFLLLLMAEDCNRVGINILMTDGRAERPGDLGQFNGLQRSSEGHTSQGGDRRATGRMWDPQGEQQT